MLDRIVVEGEVPDVESLERISGIASIYDEEFVNNMWVGGDHQVQLQVVFAELNRSGLARARLQRDLGHERPRRGVPDGGERHDVVRDAGSANNVNGGIARLPGRGRIQPRRRGGQPAQLRRDHRRARAQQPLEDPCASRRSWP